MSYKNLRTVYYSIVVTRCKQKEIVYVTGFMVVCGYGAQITCDLMLSIMVVMVMINVERGRKCGSQGKPW